MKYLFAYLDVNGDGVLNKREAERAPAVNQIISFLTSFGGGGFSPKMDALDANKDGKVSMAELSAYYRKNGFQPFQFQFDLSNDARGAMALYFGGSRPDPEVAAVSKAIFALLDSDKDGKLTQKELDAAPSVLLARDENEDEIITAQELVPETKPKGDPFAYAMASNSGNNGSAGNHLLVPIPTPGQAPAELARRMYERYDPSAKKEAMKTLAKARPGPAMAKPAPKAESKPKMSPPPAPKKNVKEVKPSKETAKGKGKKQEPELKLTRKQLRLDEATFARLDADKDGVLNAKELAAFAQRAPDLCLALSFGEKAGNPLDLAAVMGRPALLADKIHLQDDMGLVDLGATRMELRCREEKKRSNRFLDLIRPQFSALFKQSDKKNKGYLDEKEAKSNPQIGNLFQQMDRDGDGKLYEKEMLAYFDGLIELQQRATAGCVTLVLRDLSRGLFDLLDSNRDGKLSVREINRAPKLLAMLNRQGQGCLRREDIPHSYQLALRRGPAKPPGFDQEARISELYFGKEEEEIASGAVPLGLARWTATAMAMSRARSSSSVKSCSARSTAMATV